MKNTILAITMGDPAGVGPEIIVKALANYTPHCGYTPVIVGSERALQRAFEFTGQSLDYRLLRAENELESITPRLYLWNDETHLRDEIPLASIDASAGACAFAWLDRALDWALAKKVDAIVTAPLHKESLHLAGHTYPGHTEIIAEKTGTTDFSLMLAAGAFRVVHVTCHVPVKDVPGLISQERVETVINQFHEALTRMDEKAPRLAVCALNPHGGEGGLFGREEIDAIQPAVESCQKNGITVTGPMPSDSIYPQLLGGRYDGVVAMYHDQGHIPFKLTNFGFDSEKKQWSTVVGVNISLGMPVIRTSVDHGTAFDLAGTGKASECSLNDAINAAIKLAQHERI